LLSNLALLVTSMVVALLLAEIALRISDFSYPSFYRPDDRLGLRLRENAEGWFRSEGEAYVRVNNAGFRDKERSLARSTNVFRVAVLGDSMIEALQVDLEKTFASLLEHRLNACGVFGGKSVEVMNFGVSGYGTAQQLLTYRYYASKYSPDLVLVAFFAGNDVRNNSKELEPEKVRPFFALKGNDLVEDRSFAESEEFRRRTNRLRTVLEELRVLRVVQAAYFVKDQIQLRAERPENQAAVRGAEWGLDNAVYSEPTTPQWRNAWAVSERLLAELRDEVQAAGAKLIILSLSSGIQVQPDPKVREEFLRTTGIKDIFYPNRRIEKVAAELGVQSILLGPRFQQVAEREKVFLHGFPNTRPGTGHWNEAGNRLAADIVARDLCATAAIQAGGK
jgi:hypothetical protein